MRVTGSVVIVRGVNSELTAICLSRSLVVLSHGHHEQSRSGWGDDLPLQAAW